MTAIKHRKIFLTPHLPSLWYSINMKHTYPLSSLIPFLSLTSTFPSKSLCPSLTSFPHPLSLLLFLSLPPALPLTLHALPWCSSHSPLQRPHASSAADRPGSYSDIPASQKPGLPLDFSPRSGIYPASINLLLLLLARLPNIDHHSIISFTVPNPQDLTRCFHQLVWNYTFYDLNISR